jgi:transcriptional regulator with PAS, ATPase and Fis domain
MLQRFANTLLQDLNCPGAVFDTRGRVVNANDTFRNRFYISSNRGDPVLAGPIRTALKEAIEKNDDRFPAKGLNIRHDGKPYCLNVYFLDTPSGEGTVHLLTAAPLPSETKSVAVHERPDDHEVERLSPKFSTLIGKDPSFIQALLLAQRAAQTDLPVLILGESGTGKEVLARTIHRASRRQKKPFIDVNCAAIPDSLVESELFGYEKGAFTGANTKGKAGFFESAHQGTIFMDEIGDAASQTQAKLLRVLESGQFKRIGSNRNIAVDVRLISATNQELSDRIAEGRFRADLLYRINTITIRLLPLRRRLGDLSLLAEHFLKNAAGDRTPLRFSKEATAMLHGYDWPGNVRELKGVIDYAVTMAQGKILTPRSFTNFLRSGSPQTPPDGAFRGMQAMMPEPAPEPVSDLLADVVERAEKQHIRQVMARSRTRSEAIERLGISRRTFYAKIRQYGLD